MLSSAGKAIPPALPRIFLPVTISAFVKAEARGR